MYPFATKALYISKKTKTFWDSKPKVELKYIMQILIHLYMRKIGPNYTRKALNFIHYLYNNSINPVRLRVTPTVTDSIVYRTQSCQS